MGFIFVKQEVKEYYIYLFTTATLQRISVFYSVQAVAAAFRPQKKIHFLYAIVSPTILLENYDLSYIEDIADMNVRRIVEDLLFSLSVINLFTYFNSIST